MGMSIGSSATQSNVQHTGNSSTWQQNNQAFSQLTQALQLGDLSGAQQAYTKLTANNANLLPANSPLEKLGQALNSGNLTQAQNVMSTIHTSQHHHAKEATSSFASTLSNVQA